MSISPTVVAATVPARATPPEASQAPPPPPPPPVVSNNKISLQQTHEECRSFPGFEGGVKDFTYLPYNLVLLVGVDRRLAAAECGKGRARDDGDRGWIMK